MIRATLCLCLVLLATTAGCTTNGSTGETEYYVFADQATEAPHDATVVDRQNEHITDVSAVQRAISRAERQNGSQVEVNESEYERIREQLQATPLHVSDEDRWYNSTGLYVETNSTIVRVSIGTQTPA